MCDNRSINITSLLSVQCVPYLIAMGTDPEPSMRNKADQQLVEIDKKYTGFIHVSLCSVLSSFKNLREGEGRGFQMVAF